MAFAPGITKDGIRANATGIADEIERNMMRWKAFAAKLETLTEQELTALGLDANYQTYLGSMRTDIVNLTNWYYANCAFVKQFTDLVL